MTDNYERLSEQTAQALTQPNFIKNNLTAGSITSSAWYLSTCGINSLTSGLSPTSHIYLVLNTFGPLATSGATLATCHQYSLSKVTGRNVLGSTWWGSLGHLGPIIGGEAVLSRLAIDNPWLANSCVIPLVTALVSQYTASLQYDLDNNLEQQYSQDRDLKDQLKSAVHEFWGALKNFAPYMGLGMSASLTLLATQYSQEEPPSSLEQWYYTALASLVANTTESIVHYCKEQQSSLPQTTNQWAHQLSTMVFNSLFSVGIGEVFNWGGLGLNRYTASLLSSSLQFLDYTSQRGILHTIFGGQNQASQDDYQEFNNDVEKQDGDPSSINDPNEVQDNVNGQVTEDDNQDGHASINNTTANENDNNPQQPAASGLISCICSWLGWSTDDDANEEAEAGQNGPHTLTTGTSF